MRSPGEGAEWMARAGHGLWGQVGAMSGPIIPIPSQSPSLSHPTPSPSPSHPYPHPHPYLHPHPIPTPIPIPISSHPNIPPSPFPPPWCCPEKVCTFYGANQRQLLIENKQIKRERKAPSFPSEWQRNKQALPLCLPFDFGRLQSCPAPTV